ncbi:helix-turn-helix domain-containing protein (plasmid) [Haloimpatiens sp. FM7330]|uniref:helix-turn-helix domain-containing protein n=1 Tax=Haloimpatiens sp. FM7330 TaxID=3298610 RepID=UPI00363165EF
MDTKIITCGEKLKKIRKQYKIKQYELSGDKLTRNMISMLETDKTGLTKNTAEILIENIHKICEKKSIKCDITLEYLLKSAQCQGKSICEKFIVFLDSTPEKVFEDKYQETVDEIQKILNKYKLKEEKIIIYTKLGEIFKKSYNFYKAYTYFIMAFESYTNSFNNSELIELIIDITYCCNNLKRFKETLDFNRLAYIYMDNIPEDIKYKIKFNNIIAYKNLKNYTFALKEIEQIEHTFKDKLIYEPIEKINILILKANCLKEKGFYVEALQIHNEILILNKNDIEMSLVVLCNTIELYIEMNDSRNIKKYIDKSLPLLKEYKEMDEKKYCCEIYNDIGLGLYTIKNFKMSKQYFNEALNKAKKYKQISIINSSMENLLKIAVNDSNVDELDNLKNQLLEIISLKLLPENNTLIFQFIEYYNRINDRETISNIIHFIKEKL